MSRIARGFRAPLAWSSLARCLPLLAAAPVIAGGTFSLVNPSSDPSSRFGAEVITLSNGNVVVTDPVLNVNGNTASGAVYLFNGTTGSLISTLAGTAPNEAVGGGGIGALANGNFVVFSNFGAADASHPGFSATFVDGIKGLNGTVSIQNSLVQAPAAGSGAQTNCQFFQPQVSILACQNTLQNILTINPANGGLAAQGSPWVIGAPYISNSEFTFVPLATGNYLILTPGSGVGGAVTFGNGATGVSGVISASNSLVGQSGDLIGSNWSGYYSTANQLKRYSSAVANWDSVYENDGTEFASPSSGSLAFLPGVVVYPNGDYSVGSLSGTRTLASGVTGATGTIPIASTFSGNITALTNGNYVVTTTSSATFVNGKTMTAVNTLTTPTGVVLVTALTNGNYVVSTAQSNPGSATFVNGTTGLGGSVSADNSLVGTNASDHVGTTVVPLPNGNYVVISPFFNGNRGAVTFGNGTTGVSGQVSSNNSLVGASAGDVLGNSAPLQGFAILTNGNFVVGSPGFKNGAGAATWGSGTTGVTGTVSASNSLVGASPGDGVGSFIMPLANGNYVVASPNFGGGSTPPSALGAVTFANGANGTSGVVSSSNSLVGGTQGDRVGSGLISPLSNGNYVVVSPQWSNGQIAKAGAVTFGNGTTGIAGPISSSNSLVGTNPNDMLGSGANYLNTQDYSNLAFGVQVGECSGSCGAVLPLSNGNYVVMSPQYNGGMGAATFGNGTSGVSGSITPQNSLVGTAPTDHVSLGGIQPLPSGNYVVMSPLWSSNTGAATFGNGTRGVAGAISSSNSLVGAAPGDFVGFVPWLFLGGIDLTTMPLGNNNNSFKTSGSAGIFTGLFNTGGGSGNSVSDLARFKVPSSTPTVVPAVPAILSSGDYMVLSPFFNGEQGAATLGSGVTGVTGVVSTSNSFVGNVAHGYFGSKFREDQAGFDKTVVSGLVDLGMHSTSVQLPATSVTINTNPPGLKFSIDNGAPQTAGTITLLPGSHTLSVAAQPASTGSQYAFASWSDGSSSASRSLSVGMSALTLTANFQTQYQLTISASPANGGAVSPANGSFFNSGSTVDISATAGFGFTFANWSGPVASASSASTTVTMSGPLTVTANFQASGATCTVGTPQITSVNYATDFGGFANFSSGSYLEVKGSNLAVDQRQWATGDFQGDNAPTVLDSSKVTIDSVPGYVSYISAQQINVQAPADPATGPVPIVVTNCAGTSNTFTLQKNTVTPGMLAPASFNAGKQYLAALFAADLNQGAVTFVGNTGLVAGANFRPAKPDDVVVMYGLGFGSVTPATPPGVVAAGSTNVSGVSISFGSTPAAVGYAGLYPGFVGLYEFYVTVPDVADGDSQINISVNGTSVPQTLFLTVQH